MIKTCPKCKFQDKDFSGATDSACPKCGIIYAKFAARSSVDNNLFRGDQGKRQKVSTPLISLIFYFLAFAGLLISFWLGFGLVLIEDGSLGGLQHMIGLAWMAGGVIQSSVFCAIGIGLKYLNGIYQVAISEGN